MEDKKNLVDFGGLLTEPLKLSKKQAIETEPKKERFSNIKSLQELLSRGTLFAQAMVVVVLLATVFFTLSSLVFLTQQEDVRLAKSKPLPEYPSSSIQLEDEDHDGLPDIKELTYGTNVTKPDTDGDGAPDGWEVKYELNPNNPLNVYEDPDKDGLSNIEEYIYNTNPNNPDTDGDGIIDEWETRYALDPLNSSDASEDPDKDNLTNLEEYRVLGREYTIEGLTKKYTQYTSIYSNDTDNDGLTDWEEIYVTKTLPYSRDSDGDGVPDNWEIRYGFDPNSGFDANTDNDNDGLSNIGEWRFGTNPNKNDTDADGMSDGWETANLGDWVNGSWQLDPLNPNDAAGDLDGDNLTNLQEFQVWNNLGKRIDPYKADTEDDGLTDYEEVVVYRHLYPDPTKKDTDNDGLSDGDEVKKYGTNCSYFDTDYDGLSDWDEVMIYHTCPTDKDIDRDTLTDKEEVLTGVDGIPGYPHGWQDPKNTSVLYHTDPWNPDSDYDGLRDDVEVKTDFYPDTPEINGTNALKKDTDGDGMDDGWEYLHSDIDGDGAPTWWELSYGLDTLDSSDGNKDFDRDGATNLGEYMNNTDPTNPDTNKNGILDGNERQRMFVRLAISKQNRINPLDPTDKYRDPDRDDLFNIEEYKCREKGKNITADPNNRDTDGDGLPDGWEYQNRRWHSGEDYRGWDLDPIKKDSDGDGVYDYYEDFDNDSLINFEEYLYEGDPHEKDADYDSASDGKELRIDSDGDGMLDLWELIYGLNPFDSSDASRDRDGDGYTNIQEFRKLTDPNNLLSFPT
jgi:hypothetical protein